MTAADLTTLYVSEGRSKLTQSGLESGKTAVCEPGDLLIGTRTRVGNCAIAKVRMGASQDITRARLKPGCLPEFFRYYFAHVANELAFYSQGTSIQGITREILNELQIPVPPLGEQRRIVARIEALTSRLAQAQQARQAATAEAEKIMQAAVRAAIEERDDLIETTLGKVCTMKTGKTPPTSRTEYFDGDIPFVCPADVGITLRIRTAQRTVSQLAVRDGKANLFPAGTVLVVGIGATVGKVGIAGYDLCTNQQITGLTFNSEVLPDYAAWFLTTQREVIATAAAGGGVPIINQRGLGELPFYYPPSGAVQRAIVARLDALRTKLEELRRLQGEVEAELGRFLPALLAKAFRGEL